MNGPIFGFGNIVVVEGNLVGVIVKSWGPIMLGGELNPWVPSQTDLFALDWRVMA